MNQPSESASGHGQVRHLSPDTMHKNPAYSQAIVVSGPVRTIYIGGQDSVDVNGTIVGKGDLAAQVEQVLQNIQSALTASGAGVEHVIKWNLYIVQGQSLQTGYAAFQRFWGNRSNPPVITAMFVSGLAHPDFLLEMDAVAVVPL
ncbi:MAG TPA: RidA family protein [Anaerolineaceae bacterium]|nr:RidA family protein [Anaerolineaceae bacterium]